MRIKENQRGITLIALVITIIVLLILAGVTIAMVVGDNGILQRSKDSKTETEISKEKEQINLAYTAITTSKLSENDNTNIKDTELRDEINRSINDDTVAVQGNDDLIITYQKTKRSYILKQDGKIEETDSNANPEETKKYIGSSKWMIEDNTLTGYNGTVTDLLAETDLEDTIVIPNYVLNESGEEIKVNEIGPNLGTSSRPLFALGSIMSGLMSSGKQYNLIISEGIEKINMAAFASNSFLKGEVIIPNSIVEIKQAAFSTCSNITKVTIEDGEKELIFPDKGAQVFENCTNLREVVIPSRVNDDGIGYRFFSNCTNLSNIYIKKEQDTLTGYPWGAPSNPTVTWN